MQSKEQTRRGRDERQGSAFEVDGCVTATELAYGCGDRTSCCNFNLIELTTKQDMIQWNRIMGRKASREDTIEDRKRKTSGSEEHRMDGK